MDVGETATCVATQIDWRVCVTSADFQLLEVRGCVLGSTTQRMIALHVCGISGVEGVNGHTVTFTGRHSI